MPSDYPDWGGQYNDKQFFPLFDQAELAARLGSYLTYDRRGSVIWQYGFDHGVGDVGPGHGGTDSSVAIITDQWEIPPFSCYLVSGNAPDDYASIERRVAVPQPPRVGFQLSLRCYTSTQYVNMWVIHQTGTIRYRAAVRINLVDNLLELFAAPEVFYSLLDPLPGLNQGLYYAHVKLVCNLDTHVCERVVLDDREFDVTAYAMAGVADTTAPNLWCQVYNYTLSTTQSRVSADNMIITAAEPPNS